VWVFSLNSIRFIGASAGSKGGQAWDRHRLFEQMLVWKLDPDLADRPRSVSSLRKSPRMREIGADDTDFDFVARLLI